MTCSVEGSLKTGNATTRCDAMRRRDATLRSAKKSGTGPQQF